MNSKERVVATIIAAVSVFLMALAVHMDGLPSIPAFYVGVWTGVWGYFVCSR